jgi:hypothetical protein
MLNIIKTGVVGLISIGQYTQQQNLQMDYLSPRQTESAQDLFATSDATFRHDAYQPKEDKKDSGFACGFLSAAGAFAQSHPLLVAKCACLSAASLAIEKNIISPEYTMIDKLGLLDTARAIWYNTGDHFIRTSIGLCKATYRVGKNVSEGSYKVVSSVFKSTYEAVDSTSFNIKQGVRFAYNVATDLKVREEIIKDVSERIGTSMINKTSDILSK